MLAGETKTAQCDCRDSFERLTTLYNIYRDYMKHEDDLLNQRTTWLLVIQGFLFATLGVLGEWVLQPGQDRLGIERQFLVYVLVVVGVVVASVAFLGITAASDAIDELRRKWELIRVHYQGWENLPEIAGGGDPTAHQRGKWPPRLIPAAIFIAWIGVLVLAFLDFHFAKAGH